MTIPWGKSESGSQFKVVKNFIGSKSVAALIYMWQQVHTGCLLNVKFDSEINP
jgi:hypothetical protein